MAHSLRSGQPGCVEDNCHSPFHRDARLHATLKWVASYLIAGALLIGRAAQLLLITLWINLIMFATALQSTHVGTDRRQLQTAQLAQPAKCIAHMLWLLLLLTGHTASNVHSIAAIYLAIMFIKTQHVLIMCILILHTTCAIMQMTPLNIRPSVSCVV